MPVTKKDLEKMKTQSLTIREVEPDSAVIQDEREQLEHSLPLISEWLLSGHVLGGNRLTKKQLQEKLCLTRSTLQKGIEIARNLTALDMSQQGRANFIRQTTGVVNKIINSDMSKIELMMQKLLEHTNFTVIDFESEEGVFLVKNFNDLMNQKTSLTKLLLELTKFTFGSQHRENPILDILDQANVSDRPMTTHEVIDHLDKRGVGGDVEDDGQTHISYEQYMEAKAKGKKI